MRGLAWLPGICLVLAACSSVNPIGLGDAGPPSTGHAGTTGSAGTTGAAGAGTGAAGVMGVAGHMGDTGAAGDTGLAGTNGAAGTTGAAGTPADGGVHPDGGNTCSGLEEQYAQALTAARMCNIALDRLTCQISVDTSLSCPTCKTWVDNKTQLDQIRKTWQSAGCDQVKHICPAIACVNPGRPGCAPPKTGIIGTCGGPTIQPL